MYYSNTIFNQILAFVPKHQLKHLVGQHNGDRYMKKMTAWNQFVVLMYAQATGKDSLRDIETGLLTCQNTWSHLGIQTVAKTSVARANNTRTYKIFESLFYTLLKQCSDITPERNFTFANPLYSLDATVVRLCLSLFDWASYQHEKGAIKIHTLINNRTLLPELLNISTGKMADITGAKGMNISIPRGSIMVFDRGYVDFKWWNELNTQGIFFVTRTKSNQLFVVSGVHKEPHGKILADEVVWVGDVIKEDYPHEVRRVRYIHDDGEVYEYVTNNFTLTGEEVALVYKERWQIELFFKWIKQNLKIKSFLGTSENAVMSQIWVAMTYYLLLSYIKFQTKFGKSLLELSRMIKETLFTRRPLIDLLSLSTTTISRILEPEVVQLLLMKV